MSDERYILCPYCKKTFTISEDELYNNETFECPHCHAVNAGCSETDEYGVLIGVSVLDEQLRELLRGKEKGNDAN